MIDLGNSGFFKFTIYKHRKRIDKDTLEDLLVKFKISKLESLEINWCEGFEDAILEIDFDELRSK